MPVHPDTYLTRLTAFTTYDGVTMPQSHEWDDSTTPRTDNPVRFVWRTVCGKSYGYPASSRIPSRIA